MLGPDDLRRYIREREIEAELLPVAEGHTSGKAADSLDIRLEEVAKTIVFVDEDGGPVLAIVRGAVRVRQNEFSRKVGATKLRLATHDEVLKFTGFPAGGVSPIANLCRDRVYMDRRLLDMEHVYAGGGSEAFILKIKPADMLRESGAQLIEIPAQPTPSQ
ncbi:MAG: YbaK/EbsC family protein [Conexivisphaerales archaeon]|jgi:prolyl-tRNA editing enzyme YbaK/EbsC (Cys-tRNA(Pro) deacylase)